MINPDKIFYPNPNPRYEGIGADICSSCREALPSGVGESYYNWGAWKGIDGANRYGKNLCVECLDELRAKYARRGSTPVEDWDCIGDYMRRGEF